MQFEWDERKNQTNIRKHGIDFNDAINIFLDPYRMERVDDGEHYGETRFQALSMAKGRVLVVIYTYRNDHIRMISARKANRHERRTYHEGYFGP